MPCDLKVRSFAENKPSLRLLHAIRYDKCGDEASVVEW
jgi:hypothetical protein